MKATTSCSWVITLSLMSIFSAVVGAIPAHSQSAAAPGSVGSHPGGSQESLLSAKPRVPIPMVPIEACDPLIYLTRHRRQMCGRGH